MDDLRKLAYCLAASGGAVSEQGYHLLYEEYNELYEEIWDGAKVVKDFVVGDNVRNDAPAAYVLVASDEEGIPDKRIAFSVDTNNILQYFVYSDEDEEWADGSLSQGGYVKVHSASALAADVSPEGITLFFQNKEGKIQTLILRGESWELGEILPASPRGGSPLSTLATESAFLLFYLAEDNVMHYLARSYETNTWEDHSWASVEIPSPVHRVRVSHDPENDVFEAHVIIGDKLFRFAGTEAKVELGTIKDREFVPTNAAQASRRISGAVIRNGRLVGWEEKHTHSQTHRDGHKTTRTTRRFYPV